MYEKWFFSLPDASRQAWCLDFVWEAYLLVNDKSFEKCQLMML